MASTYVNLPDCAEVRRRINIVQDPKLKALLKTLFLFASDVSDLMGEVEESHKDIIHPVIGPKGSDVKVEEVFIQHLDRMTPICFFEFKRGIRKSEPIPRKIALPKEFDKWTEDLLDYFRKAGDKYVFPFSRVDAQNMMEKEKPFDGLKYPVESTGKPKELWMNHMQDIRMIELKQEYNFGLEEMIAYGNSKINVPQDIATQFDYSTIPEDKRWEIYINKLCRIKRTKNYTIEEFVSDSGYERREIVKWVKMLTRKNHLIFQGPPGTGKSFVAQRLADYFVSGTNGDVKMVQFHPDYSYEDFVQGYFPETRSTGFQFELRKGIFRRFCENAQTEPKAHYVLIIDEINRANLSRVFGELMYLMEYRKDEITLASGGEPFRIPDNVYVIGTMNTADRTIALVDTALRRRFSFVRLKPEYGILKKHLQTLNLPIESLIRVLEEINKVIDDPNYEIGISFFLNLKDREHLKELLPIIWESEIEPYLEEYFYDQPDKVDQFRWKALVKNELNEWAIDAGQ